MSNMSGITMIVGAVLAAYGGISYATAESKSVTALIPAFFGIAFLILGLLATREKLRKHAMHLAAAVGLLGFLGGAGMGFPKIPALASGTLAEGKTPDKAKSAENAARSQILLGVVCLAFVLMCIHSFVQARRARKAPAESSQGAK